MQRDSEDSRPLDFDTFMPSHDPSLAQTPQHALEPNDIPPAPVGHVGRDEAFNRALGAMYWVGYWTAIYHVRPQIQMIGPILCAHADIAESSTM